jgi:hypothetical protein
MDSGRGEPIAVRIVHRYLRYLAIGTDWWTYLLSSAVAGYLAFLSAERRVWFSLAAFLALVVLSIANALPRAVRRRQQHAFRASVAAALDRQRPLEVGQAAIRIRRQPTLVRAAAEYPILIDELAVGAVSVGQLVTFIVPPGDHRVRIKDPKYGQSSEEWGVQVAEGEYGEFICQASWDRIELFPVEWG